MVTIQVGTPSLPSPFKGEGREGAGTEGNETPML